VFKATTILAYKKDDKAVIGGDGQVTFGDTILKGNATKIRSLYKVRFSRICRKHCRCI